ncbi:hypothetical protein HK405_005690 [Cladochytrium tenue]|nr:hypothetical protein HK405_005690 [Cladochytrium tenue]
MAVVPLVNPVVEVAVEDELDFAAVELVDSSCKEVDEVLLLSLPEEDEGDELLELDSVVPVGDNPVHIKRQSSYATSTPRDVAAAASVGILKVQVAS